jgi:SOS-response transcriptional repressor LexA
MEIQFIKIIDIEPVNKFIQFLYNDYKFFNALKPRTVNQDRNNLIDDVTQKLLLNDPKELYICAVQGGSMKDVGIVSGSKLIIETAKDPKNGDIAVVKVNEKYYVKRFFDDEGSIRLVSENNDFPDYDLKKEDVEVYGIVRLVITNPT